MFNVPENLLPKSHFGTHNFHFELANSGNLNLVALWNCISEMQIFSFEFYLELTFQIKFKLLLWIKFSRTITTISETLFQKIMHHPRLNHVFRKYFLEFDFH